MEKVELSSFEVSVAGQGPAAKVEPMEHAFENVYDRPPETLLRRRHLEEVSPESPSLERRRGSSSVFDDSSYF